MELRTVAKEMAAGLDQMDERLHDPSIVSMTVLRRWMVQPGLFAA